MARAGRGPRHSPGAGPHFVRFANDAFTVPAEIWAMTQTSMNPASGLPTWAWLWVPLAWLPCQFALAAADPGGALYARLVAGEFGIVEVLTAGMLLPATYFAFRASGALVKASDALPGVLLILFALGCLFLYGEEVSYGQHLFGWGTPEGFAEANTQGETNLHNLEGFDKSLAKWVVLAGLTLGGIVLPLMARAGRAPAWPRWARPLVPTAFCLPAAALALGSHLLVKVVAKTAGFRWEEATGVRLSETVELYIALFFVLYAWGAYQQCRERRTVAAHLARSERARGRRANVPAGASV